MRRFVFLIVWQADDAPPSRVARWVVLGLAAVGVAVAVAWRVLAA